jgi:hypothetical protein
MMKGNDTQHSGKQGISRLNRIFHIVKVPAGIAHGVQDDDCSNN